MILHQLKAGGGRFKKKYALDALRPIYAQEFEVLSWLTLILPAGGV